MEKPKTFCLALDLKPDPALIDQYIRHHQKVWPGVTESLKESDIEGMEIYRVENRLFMIIRVNAQFDFSRKAQLDRENPVVRKWEQLMEQYQQPIPGGRPDEKWRLMEKIFEWKIRAEKSPPG